MAVAVTLAGDYRIPMLADYAKTSKFIKLVSAREPILHSGSRHTAGIWEVGATYMRGNPVKATPARKRRYLALLGIVIGCYVIVSYLVLPATWARIEHEPGLSGHPMVTATAQGIPGDPINVGLIGEREDVVYAFHLAGWYPADPITLRSSLEIIGSVVLDRPYKTAPVSPLFFEGRHEDLAFEKPHGGSADRRQHVRLWLVLAKGSDAAPVWLGSATYDSGVTLSRDTGQVTHKIAPNVDAERDRLMDDLNKAQVVARIYQVKGIGPTLNGRNGEGDPYYTDGEIWLARLVRRGEKATTIAEKEQPPQLILIKDAVFSWYSSRE
jgi:LssY-like putative type I secretion system component LssY